MLNGNSTLKCYQINDFSKKFRINFLTTFYSKCISSNVR